MHDMHFSDQSVQIYVELYGYIPLRRKKQYTLVSVMVKPLIRKKKEKKYTNDWFNS